MIASVLQAGHKQIDVNYSYSGSLPCGRTFRMCVYIVDNAQDTEYSPCTFRANSVWSNKLHCSASCTSRAHTLAHNSVRMSHGILLDSSTWLTYHNMLQCS